MGHTFPPQSSFLAYAAGEAGGGWATPSPQPPFLAYAAGEEGGG